MKMKYLVAVVLMLLTGVAFAAGNGNGNGNGPGGSQAAAVGVGVGVAVANPAVSASANTSTERNTPPAIAPGLAVSNEACMGSSSAGGSGGFFGFSIGTSWKNADCELRQNAKTLAAFGDMEAARALMCLNEKVHAAYAKTKNPCGTVVIARPAVYGNPSGGGDMRQTSFIQ
jgi:hypothetical protein